MANYLYNSVELPALPDYNGTTYPFAVIIRFLSSGGYGLACSNLPFWVVNVDGTDALALSVESDVIFFNCSAGDDSWQTSGSAFDPDPDALWIYMKPSAVQYVWTNSNICRESTTDVIYAASDPVLIVTPEKPVVSAAWLRSFQTGLALGLAGKPLPIKKEPVAYLYNGVRLPKLTEWDKEKYPYAFITALESSSSTDAYMYCSTVPIYRYVKGLFAQCIAKADGTAICYSANMFADGTVFKDWEQFADGTVLFTADTSFTVINTGSRKWANYNMLDYSDDSVYIAASEPVPVYE